MRLLEKEAGPSCCQGHYENSAQMADHELEEEDALRVSDGGAGDQDGGSTEEDVNRPSTYTIRPKFEKK